MILTAILTFGGKYFVQNFENLKLPIQMQLCEKRSLFSEVFAPFLNSISNFEHFERKYNIFLKLLTVKIFVRKLYKEPRFRTGFGNQHVKASQILAKSP